MRHFLVSVLGMAHAQILNIIHGLHRAALSVATAIVFKIKYARVALYFQALFLGFIIDFFLFTPRPNFAAMILAVAAVFMAVRAGLGSFSRTEQVVWVLVAIALCVVEFRALDKDQREREEQNAAIRWQDNFNRKQERRQFADLLKQGRLSFGQEKQYAERTL